MMYLKEPPCYASRDDNDDGVGSLFREEPHDVKFVSSVNLLLIGSFFCAQVRDFEGQEDTHECNILYLNILVYKSINT